MKHQQHIYLGRVAGIPVTIHTSWLLFLPLGMGKLTLSTAAEFNWPLLLCWQVATILTILMALSVVLHEVGHLATAVLQRLPLRQIILYPFGGISRFSHLPIPAAAFLKMTVAGPLVSLLQAGLWAGAWGVWDMAIFLWVAQFNLVLGLLNLLPAVSLDGGRLLALLTNRYPYGQVKTLISMLTAAVLTLGFNLAGGLAFMMGLFFLDLALIIDGALFLSVGLLLRQPAEHKAQIYTPQAIQLLAQTQVGELVRERAVPVSASGRWPYPTSSPASFFSADTSEPAGEIGYSQRFPSVLQSGIIHPTTSLAHALHLLNKTGLPYLMVAEGHRIIDIVSREQILNHLPSQTPTQLPRDLNFYILLDPHQAPRKRSKVKLTEQKGKLWN